MQSDPMQRLPMQCMPLPSREQQALNRPPSPVSSETAMRLFRHYVQQRLTNRRALCRPSATIKWY
jgi:hypothetical protein